MADLLIPNKERGQSIPVKVALLCKVYEQMRWMEDSISFGIHRDSNYIDLLKMQIELGVKYVKPCRCNT